MTELEEKALKNVAIVIRDFINANEGDVSALFKETDENGTVTMTDLGNLLIKSAIIEAKE